MPSWWNYRKRGISPRPRTLKDSPWSSSTGYRVDSDGAAIYRGGMTDATTNSDQSSPSVILPHYPGQQEAIASAAGQAVALRGLTKSFDGRRVVDAIDLDVPTGSFFGLVGPNGAGKTTTLSMVTGWLRHESGTVSVLGHDVWSDPLSAKRIIGVLPDGL